MEKLSPSRDNYNALVQYGTTKLLNIAFSNAINRRKVLNKVRSNSLHPGNLIPTSLSQNWWGYRLLFSLLRPFTKSLVSISFHIFVTYRNKLKLDHSTFMTDYIFTRGQHCSYSKYWLMVPLLAYIWNCAVKWSGHVELPSASYIANLDYVQFILDLTHYVYSLSSFSWVREVFGLLLA